MCNSRHVGFRTIKHLLLEIVFGKILNDFCVRNIQTQLGHTGLGTAGHIQTQLGHTGLGTAGHIQTHLGQAGLSTGHIQTQLRHTGLVTVGHI